MGRKDWRERSAYRNVTREDMKSVLKEDLRREYLKKLEDAEKKLEQTLDGDRSIHDAQFPIERSFREDRGENDGKSEIFQNFQKKQKNNIKSSSGEDSTPQNVVYHLKYPRNQPKSSQKISSKKIPLALSTSPLPLRAIPPKRPKSSMGNFSATRNRPRDSREDYNLNSRLEKLSAGSFGEKEMEELRQKIETEKSNKKRMYNILEAEILLKSEDHSTSLRDINRNLKKSNIHQLKNYTKKKSSFVEQRLEERLKKKPGYTLKNTEKNMQKSSTLDLNFQSNYCSFNLTTPFLLKIAGGDFASDSKARGWGTYLLECREQLALAERISRYYKSSSPPEKKIRFKRNFESKFFL